MNGKNRACGKHDALKGSSRDVVRPQRPSDAGRSPADRRPAAGFATFSAPPWAVPRPVLLGLVVASLFYFFSYPGVDNDLWGHLFFGKEILREGRLPQQNLYSYTAPTHPWINHEWLAEVGCYAVYRALGSPGLVWLKILVGGAIVWLLDRILWRQGPFPAARVAALVWVMAILSPGFNVRPQLGSFLLLAALMFLADRFEARHGPVLYWAPCIMALWANLHGGFVAGLGALALFGAWSIPGLWRAGDARWRAPLLLLVPLGLCLPALGLNPFGLRLLGFVARDLRIDRPITEWQPVNLLDGSFPAFKLALVAMLPIVFKAGSWRRWQVPLAALAALFALQHQRHIPLFGIVAAPLLAESVQGLLRRVRPLAMSALPSRLTRGVVLAALLGGALYQAIWIGRIHLRHGFRIVLSPLEYPTLATDFMTRNGVRGNLAAPFDWGEYLIWKLYPQARVSIDGRYTTAYPMEVIEGLWGWQQGRREWRNLAERYPTDLAITRPEQPITGLLLADPRWVCLYQDATAAIFVRDVASQADLLRRSKAGRLLPPRDPGSSFPG